MRKKKKLSRKKPKRRIASRAQRVKLYNSARKKYFVSVRKFINFSRTFTVRRNASENGLNQFIARVSDEFRKFFHYHTRLTKKKSNLFAVSLLYSFGKHDSGFGLPRTEINSPFQLEMFLADLKEEFLSSMRGYLKEKGRSRVTLKGARFEAVKFAPRKWKGFDWKTQRSKLIKQGMKKSKKAKQRVQTKKAKGRKK